VYAHVSSKPIPRISHHTVIFCRNLRIDKGDYVKQADFSNYAKN